MTDSEILKRALEAQLCDGPKAFVEVLIKRLPSSRYKKLMRFRPRQGPWGVIKAITSEGTIVIFESARLITFLSPIKLGSPPRVLQSRADRVKIHMVISKTHAERIAEIASRDNLTLSAVVDKALGQFIFAGMCT